MSEEKYVKMFEEFVNESKNQMGDLKSHLDEIVDDFDSKEELVKHINKIIEKESDFDNFDKKDIEAVKLVLKDYYDVYKNNYDKNIDKIISDRAGLSSSISDLSLIIKNLKGYL